MSKNLPFLLVIQNQNQQEEEERENIEEERVEEDKNSISKLKLFYLDRMFTTLFSNELDLLSKEIEQKANYELQNSTVSETLNNEDNSIQYEIFEVFEEHFIRPLLEMKSIGTLWTSPLINTYNDIIKTIPSSTSITTTTNKKSFNLSLLINSTDSNHYHSCIPVFGTSFIFHQSNLLSFIHSLSSTIESPIILKTNQQLTLSLLLNEEIILIPTHIENIYWILSLPKYLFQSNQEINSEDKNKSYEILSNVNCHPRIIESINALRQRFELYLPLNVPNFDPYNVEMISNLLTPTAPIKSTFGSLTPAPPPTTPPSNISYAPTRLNFQSRTKNR